MFCLSARLTFFATITEAIAGEISLLLCQTFPTKWMLNQSYPPKDQAQETARSVLRSNRFKQKIYYVFRHIKNLKGIFSLVNFLLLSVTTSFPEDRVSHQRLLKVVTGSWGGWAASNPIVHAFFWHCPHEPNDRTWKEWVLRCNVTLSIESFAIILGKRPQRQLLSLFRATSESSLAGTLISPIRQCSPHAPLGAI